MDGIDGSATSECMVDGSSVVIDDVYATQIEENMTVVMTAKTWQAYEPMKYLVVDGNGAIVTSWSTHAIYNTDGSGELAVIASFASSWSALPYTMALRPQWWYHGAAISVTTISDFSRVDHPVFYSQGFDPLSELIDTVPHMNYSLNVPHIAQAPYADRSHPYDEACEETSLLMVDHYYNGQWLSKEMGQYEIPVLSAWHIKNGYGIDLGVEWMASFAREYFDTDAATYFGGDVTIENMKKLLSAWYPVVLPTAGELLNNPYFRNAPPYHVIVLVGYDHRWFLAHDPGTRNGEFIRYSYETIDNAVHDRNGTKENVLEWQRAMLVIEPTL